MDWSLSHGFDYLATGHYVQIIHQKDQSVIKRALDKTRDQLYGFSVISPDKLRHALTPLGTYLKVDIRKHAQEIGLPFIQKESRGLCFTKEPFGDFFKKITKYPIPLGHFTTPEGYHLSTHKGQQAYTRGQKVTIGSTQYVVNQKQINGDITVSPRSQLFEYLVRIRHLNWMVDPKTLSRDQVYQIMVNYNTDSVNCQIETTRVVDETTLVVRTHLPVYAPTSGYSIRQRSSNYRRSNRRKWFWSRPHLMNR